MDQTSKGRRRTTSNSKKKPQKKKAGEQSKPEPPKKSKPSKPEEASATTSAENKSKQTEADPSVKTSEKSKPSKPEEASATTSAEDKSKQTEADPSVKTSADEKSNQAESDPSATSAEQESNNHESDPSAATDSAQSHKRESEPSASSEKSKQEDADLAATATSKGEDNLPLLDVLIPLRRDTLDDLSVRTSRKKPSKLKSDPCWRGSSSSSEQTKLDRSAARSSSSSESQKQPKRNPSAAGSSNSFENQHSSSPSPGVSHESWAKLTAAYLPKEPTSLDTAATGPVREKNRASIDELIPKVEDFLTNFIKNGDGNKPYYPSLVAGMNARFSMRVPIDFYDLLSDRAYVDLALKIGNEESHDWMVPTVFTVLKSFGYAGPRVNISILRKPTSIDYIEDHMLSKPCWASYLCCEDNICAPTPHGRGGMIAGIRAVLQKQISRISYGGELKKEDMLIIDSSKCLLFGTRLPCNARNCKLDMANVWSIYEPFFDMGNGSYPLDFDDLISELVSVEESRVSTERYRELMWFYPTLASPDARDEFVKRFCIAVRQMGEVLHCCEANGRGS